MPESAPSDSELLVDWLKNHREGAFHTLVSRYAGLVHMAAKRTSGDETLAAEASQLTFILLARKAKSLTSRTSLAGWLHLTAVMHSKNLLRQRRRESSKHQLLQSTMEIHQPDQHADQWKEMQPVLDEALSSLSEKDREALLLRFYRALTIREVATTLGIATDAAQKRIDRATERLRGKLALRGCQAGVSLPAAMLGGFAADAQAALPVSALATKALAAVSLSISSLPAIFPTIVTLMKSTQVIPPLVALLLAGAFIGSKYQSLTAMEQSNAGLRKQIAAARGKDPATVASSKFIRGDGSVDWKGLIEELYDPNASNIEGRSRAARLLEAYLDSLQPRELASKLQEIDALGLSAVDLMVVEQFVMDCLSEKAPGLVLSWVLAHHPDGDFGPPFQKWMPTPGDADFAYRYAMVLGLWAARDLASATEWLDREVAAGNFASLSLDGTSRARTDLERALMRQLVKKDPAGINRRLAAMPEEQRRSVVASSFFNGDSWITALKSLAPAEYVKVIRGNLPSKDVRSILRNESSRILDHGDYPEVTAYFKMVQATPEEKVYCIRSAVTSKFHGMFLQRPVTRSDLDAMREWVGSQAPTAADEITGEVLGKMAKPTLTPDGDPNYPEGPVTLSKTGFSQVAALAAHYHEASGNDVILVNFLKSDIAAENIEEARVLAGSIHDETLRAQALKKLR